MRALFLDTSYSLINIYIVEEDKVLVNKQIKVEKDMSNLILPLIRESFNEINFSINDVDKLFVAIGPGSFTGVRIGVTVMKTIAWGLNKQIIPISTLEYLSSIKIEKERITPVIDARRGNVFKAVYDSNLNLIGKEELVSFDSIKEDYIVSYDGFNDTEEANIDIIKLINKHIDDKGVNPHELVPNYLKKTEAEEKLNDKENK